MASQPLDTRTFIGPAALHAPQHIAIRLMRMIRALRTRRELTQLDPRMLRDIGVTAGDAAREALRAPWDLR